MNIACSHSTSNFRRTKHKNLWLSFQLVKTRTTLSELRQSRFGQAASVHSKWTLATQLSPYLHTLRSACDMFCPSQTQSSPKDTSTTRKLRKPTGITIPGSKAQRHTHFESTAWNLMWVAHKISCNFQVPGFFSFPELGVPIQSFPHAMNLDGYHSLQPLCNEWSTVYPLGLGLNSCPLPGSSNEFHPGHFAKSWVCKFGSGLAYSNSMNALCPARSHSQSGWLECQFCFSA